MIAMAGARAVGLKRRLRNSCICWLRIAFPTFGLTLLDELVHDGQESDEYNPVAMRELISRAKFVEHAMIYGTQPMEFGDREAQAWEAFSSKPEILANLRVCS